MTAWTPTFIAPLERLSTQSAVRLRLALDLDTQRGEVVEAILRWTALGVAEASIDGRLVGDALLTPGWSSYQWRLRYAEEDVTELVGHDSVLELHLGAGWYAGRLGFNGHREHYGDRTAAAAELSIRYANGSEDVIVTDEHWGWAPSSTTRADLYDGQIIDMRIGDPAAWGPVERIAAPDTSIEPYVGPPIRRHERIAAVDVWRSPAGRLLVDFGQNLVGWVQLTVRGAAGTEIVVRHAEVLEHGELGVRPLRSARATDRFVLSGDADVFEPTLTFHGFRYIDVDGWHGTDEELADAVQAVVIGSQLRRTGTFRSSSDLLNKLHENIVWGLRGNFIDVPTDCPQRDERLGWTGDIAVFAPTAAYLFDVQDFLTDWMLDLAQETLHADGNVPFVVPNVLGLEPDAATNPILGSPLPTAIWGDAAVWVPWALYEHDGDLDRLALLYPAMAAHGGAVERVLDEDGLWSQGFQFGDWLDPLAPPDDPAASLTPTTIVATASGFRTFSMLEAAARDLGDEEAVGRWGDAATRMRAGFRTRFLRDGLMATESATGYALAIAFGLLDAAEVPRAGARLAALTRENGHRIATGFAGTPYVTRALVESGHIDDAYRLLLQTECPSWLYPVTMGATTVWERWDSMLPDGSINAGEMTSFNHYALGSVAEWLHRSVGGIAPLEPGYRRVLIAPRPGPGLDWCETALDLPSGPVRVRWERNGADVALSIELSAPGVLRWPGRPDVELATGQHHFSLPTHSALA